MTFIRLISLLLLVFSGISSAEAITYPVSSPLTRELVPQNGLTQNIVTSMTEDQFGRLWIGTQDGVNVVDGNSIKLLSSLSSKEPLSGKVVISLVADNREAVWVATTQGLNRVDSRDFSVKTLHHQHKPLLGIQRMLLLDQNHLALIVNRHLLILNLNSGEFRDDALFAREVDGMGPASDGIVLKTQAGLVHYRLGQKPVELRVPDEQLADSLQYLLYGETLWLVSAAGLVVSCQEGRCQSLKLPEATDTSVHNINMTLHQDFLYFLRNDDIIIYAPVNQSFRVIRPQLPVKSYTTGANSSIKVLRTGDIVTSRRQGLLFVPDSYRNLSSYPEFSPLTGNGIYAITAVSDLNTSQEKLLMATDKGLQLYQFDTQTHQLITQINYPKKMTPALFLRFENELLLSTVDAGVFSIDLNKALLTPWLPELPKLSDAGTLIDVLKLDNSHQLLLYHQQLVLLQQKQQGYTQLWSSRIPAIRTAKMIYRNGQLVIAAYQQGLLNSQWADWNKPPANWQITAAGNPVLDINPASDGRLRLLTAEKGVQLLHIHTDSVEIEELSGEQQLLNTTAVCSVGLSDGTWLAATHDGLTLYNQNNQLVRHLTLYDGLVQKEFNQYQCGRINDKAYFSGEYGLNLIGSTEAATQHNSKLQFTHIIVDGQNIAFEQHSVDLTAPNTIVLNYSYAPYPVMAPVRFQYRLEPGNDEWFETTASTLRYTQLSTGQYQLYLRAVRFDGSLSETVQLNLHIQPVFWRSPQAYVLYGLSLIFLVWFYFRQRWQIQQAKLQVAETQQQFQLEYTDKLEEAVRLRTVKLEQQQQEFLLMQQEKIEFLTTTSHDLKNLSALIQLNLADVHKYVLPTGQESWQNVHSSCRLLNTLVDDVLELSKLKAGAVKPELQAVNLPYLLQQVYQPFKLMAEERQINLQLNINEELMVLTDPYLLARLLMNLLDNALKNLSAGHSVQLELKKRYRTSRQVYLLVRDSGPGLPEHMRKHWGLAFQRGASGYQGTGLGLSIVKKIAELLVLPVSLYSSERGTCFELRLQQTELQDQQSSTSMGHAAIIESDPQARQFLYYELVRRGFQVAVFNYAKEFARSGQRDFRVLISDIHFHASDDTIADLALLKSCLEPAGKLIFVSSDASVRHRLPDETQLYFMLKPVKRSRLAWLLAKES
ncbi:ATP-binding protein [Rheinheimera soli]|uniref:histidine kinase n=1 Tax=Rheinheimera soli TaxID=443616 RepID=A0ABU1W1V8_9GAMM|nr:ATP-binding protein [Rheinheimera soli]MDR7121780.1 signal transduction histidine kinase/ligand-binding sensor domain-containing protein [Rheinheimera soli]